MSNRTYNITGNVFDEAGEQIIFTFQMKTDEHGNIHQKDLDFLDWLSRNRHVIKRRTEKALRKEYAAIEQ